MYICKLLNELKQRGLISQITNEKRIIKILKNDIISLYCGFDPTAESLHIGHILPLLCLRLFQIYGHKPIILIGSATSIIGDPSFKNKLRNEINFNIINFWIKNIYKNISLFINFNKGKNKGIFLNNYNWFKKINVIFFLKNIGKYFSVKSMINKEFIKNRLKFSKKGILFSEFSYNLLQAYDFSYLNKKYNVILQIGGSDQWGNIISGIHLTKKLYKSKVFGVTCPLLMQSNGIKFGKTENNTIWLDNKKTSPYKFFQFWININDKDIMKFLKYFTIFPLFQLINIEEKYFCKKINPNYIKYKIAKFITILVHGKKNFLSAKRITKSLFFGNVDYLKKNDFKKLMQDGLSYLFLKGFVDLQKVLLLSKLSFSKNQARNMILSNSICINKKKINNIYYVFKKKDKLYNKYTLLSKGKKNYFLLVWMN
ncbi:tyrosine--tRNA ligase [Buchnera aphidicola]|uniref:tyrosine--tRNA ligase n=1 Tax=Buchnera aphidicola TaxID=9 RepID=UPI0031B7F993